MSKQAIGRQTNANNNAYIISAIGKYARRNWGKAVAGFFGRSNHARNSFKRNSANELAGGIMSTNSLKEKVEITTRARSNLAMKVVAGLLSLSLGGACATGKSTITEATAAGAVAGGGTFGSLYLLENALGHSPGKEDLKEDAIAAGVMAVGIIVLYCAFGGGDGSSGYQPSDTGMREQWGEDQYERNREWQRQQQQRNVPYR